LATVFTVYALSIHRGYGETEARMISFVCMVIGNLGLIFTNRSRRDSLLRSLRVPNTALWWVSGGAIGFLSLVLSIPFLRNLFQFAPLHRWELALIIVAVFISLLIAESVKAKPLRRVISGRE